MLPAWRVEVYTYSTILRHRLRAPKYDRTFKTETAAKQYAAKRRGVMSLLVPYMFWDNEIVQTTREPDWWDRLLGFLSPKA